MFFFVKIINEFYTIMTFFYIFHEKVMISFVVSPFLGIIFLGKENLTLRRLDAI